ncbi:MAG TPA: hypothetical protein ENF30_00305 [Candidatus Desulfofervidus auxilii]|uniref:Polyamine aminopropyltransferase n=1 Tax=Desulfofervidus auxilii TaxID=1621989 RepID=A0A7V0NEF4_DESA2|nr:hypothetical protein [Candidatus Desulfofervidus auxilii]
MRLRSAFIILGISATLGQILLLRELIVLLSGNEIIMGIALASWLLWTALGSFFARWIKKEKFSFFFCLSIISVTLPLCILLCRLLKPHLGLGEVTSLPEILFSCFLLILPYAFFIGALFTLGCEMLREFSQDQIITQVYLGESIGAGIGGILFYFLLCPKFPALKIALYLSLLIATYSWFYGQRIVKKFKIIGFLNLVFIFVLLLNWQWLEYKSRKWQWQPYTVLASKDSIYGHLTFLKKQNQITAYENGLYAFSYPDLATIEHAIHIPLLEHHRPKSVLLIGGGVCGGLTEVLKHPSINNITYVELDPELIKLSRAYLPIKWALKDKRVKIFYEDGRFFVKHTKRKYDVIIIYLGDPVTAQINRFYTKNFFNEVKNILKKDGILCFGVSSAPNIIGLTLADFLRNIYFTLKSVFCDVLALPGEKAYFLASPTKGNLTSNMEVLFKRIKERKIRLKYVREYYLKFDLSPLRIAYFKSLLEEKKITELNTDLKPRCYFYTMVLWGTTHFPTIRKMILKLRHLKLIHCLCFIITLSILIFLCSKRYTYIPLLNAVFITGFTEIALEIIAFISFQTFYGYVYHELAVLITTFMFGLAFGSLLMQYYAFKNIKRALLGIQAGLAIVCLFFLGIIFEKDILYIPIFIHFIFPLILLFAGILGGMQFLTATRIYLKKGIKKTASLFYATDLFGSALGALCISIIFLPILGILESLTILIFLNLSAFILLFS